MIESEETLELLAAATVSGALDSQSLPGEAGGKLSARMLAYEEAAALIGAAVDPVPAPARVKEQVMSQLSRTGATIGKDASVFAVKTAADEGWRRHSVPGVRYKELAQQNDNSVLLLMELSPGAKYPGHEHHGSERCLVVSGSFFFDDRKFVQGDFIDAPAGSFDPMLYTPEGTTLLLVVDRQDYLQ